MLDFQRVEHIIIRIVVQLFSQIIDVRCVEAHARRNQQHVKDLVSDLKVDVRGREEPADVDGEVGVVFSIRGDVVFRKTAHVLDHFRVSYLVSAQILYSSIMDRIDGCNQSPQ